MGVFSQINRTKKEEYIALQRIYWRNGESLNILTIKIKWLKSEGIGREKIAVLKYQIKSSNTNGTILNIYMFFVYFLNFRSMIYIFSQF